MSDLGQSAIDVIESGQSPAVYVKNGNVTMAEEMLRIIHSVGAGVLDLTLCRPQAHKNAVAMYNNGWARVFPSSAPLFRKEV